MQDRALYSIQEARCLLGGISRYSPAHSIEDFISSATTRFCPAIDAARPQNLRHKVAAIPARPLAKRSATNRGQFASLPPAAPSHQARKTRATT